MVKNALTMCAGVLCKISKVVPPVQIQSWTLLYIQAKTTENCIPNNLIMTKNISIILYQPIKPFTCYDMF